MTCARLFISGFVQEVGFRQSVKHHAQKLGITGWVRNLPDGRVEVVFQGKKQSVDQMIALCKKGQIVSDVKDVFVEWEEDEERFTDFTIK